MGFANRAVFALFVTLFLLQTPAADAGLTASGDLFLRFDGNLTPHTLPRHHRAPVAVDLKATIRTLSGARPPALRGLRIGLNRGGRLAATGLPTCARADLLATTPAAALANCGSALVGHGSYRAATGYPEQQTFPTRGQILAFNASTHGRPAILLHIYGTDPATITRILTLHVHRGPGTLATRITGSVSPSLNRYGYLTQIALHLHRSYRYRGKRRSYLSAACATPPGVPLASFPFARASLAFADGRTLSSSLTRTCRVRR